MDSAENKTVPAKEELRQDAFCETCGKPLQMGALFCCNCGAGVASYPVQSKEAPAVAEDVDSKKNRKTALLIALVAMGVVAWFAVLLLFVLPFINYRQTIQMMENGQYEQAIADFADMDGFLKSEEHEVECRYLLARRILAEGDYPEAMEMFEDLGVYKDSRERVLECRYSIALQQKEAGNYLEAVEIFTKLGDYKDSASLIIECDYLRACDMLSAGDHSGALKQFEALQGYKDSAEKILECKYLRACDMINAKDYVSAQAQFEMLQNYKDSTEKILECKYQLTLIMIEEGKIAEAYKQLLELDDYKDSRLWFLNVKRTYEWILAKPSIFVNAQWSEASGARHWVTTKVIDENTLKISVFGSGGAGYQTSEELVGTWDEATGTVIVTGQSYETIMGWTHCKDDSISGYIYYESGRLYLRYDEADDIFGGEFRR